MSELKVWWVPQLPMKAFNVEVDSVERAVWRLCFATTRCLLASPRCVHHNDAINGRVSDSGGLDDTGEQRVDTKGRGV